MISIHAPLAGRDGYGGGAAAGSNDFNPRAPCGARLHSEAESMREFAFQSTRPLRGATNAGYGIFAVVDISIHAPLAGRDPPPSTRSNRAGISIHAPLAGRDQDLAG